MSRAPERARELGAEIRMQPVESAVTLDHASGRPKDTQHHIVDELKTSKTENTPPLEECECMPSDVVGVLQLDEPEESEEQEPASPGHGVAPGDKQVSPALVLNETPSPQAPSLDHLLAASAPVIDASHLSPGLAVMGAGGQTAPCSPDTSEFSQASSTRDAAVRPKRPVLQRFYSLPQTPAFSPARHHFRLHNAGPRVVKLTPNISFSEDARGHFINQYLIRETVGKGTYGMVHRAVDPLTNKQYAIKEYSKRNLIKANRRMLMELRRRGKLWSGRASDLIRQEVAIMKKIDHPNLVSLDEVLEDETSDQIYMVLEWCENGTIMPSNLEYDGKADPLDEEQCRIYFRDIILAVEYLHSQGICHRDIKADNVLLCEDDVLKLADFGVSEMFDTPENDVVRRCAGSPAYWAPELARLSGGGNELIATTEINNVSGRRTDIWAMGVTLFYMNQGRLPFEANTLSDLYSQVIEGKPAFRTNCSQQLRDLFERLLDKSPATRINMSELRTHPWVTRDGTDELLSYEENTSNSHDLITEQDLRSAIEQIHVQYKDSYFDVQQAALSLQRDHGWRGTGNSPGGQESPDSVEVTEETPGLQRQNSRVQKLTLALDEIVRKMRWSRNDA